MEMKEGTVVRWQKEIGEPVEKGEPIAEIETDKVTDDLPSPYGGTLIAILVKEGTTVGVGTALAVIGELGETVVIEQTSAPSAPETRGASSPVRPPERKVPEPGGVRIEPAARRLAAELGVDLSTVTGSGPGGRITVEDVRSMS
jgi:pyruvate dehydrogenase E2 component (dihydrolipoamide acetyltransferase)